MNKLNTKRPLGWLPKASAIVFGLFSISTAHYIGFIGGLPPQIAIVGGLSLATGVTSTFLFFVVACTVLGRICGYAFSSQWMLQRAIGDRFFAKLRRKGFSAAREIVEMHRGAMLADGVIAMSSQAISFVFLMFLFYLRPPHEFPHWVFIVVLVFMLLATFARSYVFLLSPASFLRRINNGQRVRFRSELGMQLMLGLTGIAVLLSYLAGQARMRHVSNLAPVQFIGEKYTGSAKILVNVGDLYLLRLVSVGANDFVLVSKTSVITINANSADGKVFP